MAHATVDDLAGYVATVPSNAPILLERASRSVDQALLCSVYDVDDADVQTALRAATCEQVAAWLGVGEDGTGASSIYANVKIGSVTLGRTSGNGTSKKSSSSAEELAPQAWMALQQAGLTGFGPGSY